MNERPIIRWTLPMYRRFKKRYEQAVKDGEDVFNFDDNDFVTSYARHLVLYLESQGFH